MRVLFICSGNICRSPAAALCFRHRVQSRGWTGLEADSAGTLGIEGQPFWSEAARVLSEAGVEVAAHRSKGVRGPDVRSADWIVAMERAHLTWLAEHCPGGRGQRVLLRAFEHGPRQSSSPPDLDDPYGAPIEIVREELTRVVRCVDHLLAHLHPAP